MLVQKILGLKIFWQKNLIKDFFKWLLIKILLSPPWGLGLSVLFGWGGGGKSLDLDKATYQIWASK